MSLRVSLLSRPAAIARHAVLLTTGALVLVPFVWIASLSLKPPGEIFRASFSLLPEHWYALENYGRALTVAPLPRYMANGVIVCAAILGLQILVCAPCAYALAKLEFRGRDLLFGLVLVGLLLPHQVLALPLFILCYGLGLLDSYAALILPFIVSPFGIFLFRQFFRSIPDDVVHAARLDGLSEWAIVWRIMLPMAMPAVIAFSIFSVVAHWNDLFWPLIAVKTPSLMPPALGVAMFRGSEAGTDYGPLTAGAVLVVLPLVLAFLAAQRWFIEGLTSASLK
jgi:multiple sugar transport system permease protein